jgi:hypothetical protein
VKNKSGGAAMNTTTQNNEAVLEGNPADPSGQTSAPGLQTRQRPHISPGVPYDTLLDEFERNAVEAQVESRRASIFTPSYGQPF